jgi:hypothetical protein
MNAVVVDMMAVVGSSDMLSNARCAYERRGVLSLFVSNFVARQKAEKVPCPLFTVFKSEGL